MDGIPEEILLEREGGDAKKMKKEETKPESQQQMMPPPFSMPHIEVMPSLYPGIIPPYPTL